MHYEKNQRPPWFLDATPYGYYPLYYPFLLAYAALIGRLGPPDNKGPMSKKEIIAEFRGLWDAYKTHRSFCGRLFAIVPHQRDPGFTWIDLTLTVPALELKAAPPALSESTRNVLDSFDHIWVLLEDCRSSDDWDEELQDYLWYEVLRKPPAKSKKAVSKSPTPAARHAKATKRPTQIGSSSQLHMKVTISRRSRLA